MDVLERKEVSSEVINDLLTITAEIIGEKAVKVILNGINSNTGDSGKNLVFGIAEEVQKIYGSNGGYAVFRQMGRELAKKLMEKHPEDEWQAVMEIGLKIMGFADGIQKTACGACICNCVFYPDFLDTSQIKPIQHPVCWGGLGFIEGFARKIEPDVVEVRWKERDYENKRCVFEYMRGGNGKG